MRTLLELVQDCCLIVGVPSPAQVVTSQDKQILQMLALLNQELDYISQRWRWQGHNIISSFSSVNAEDQGSIYDLAPSGFLSFVPDTIWDQTLRLPVYGPKTAQEWEILKSLPTTGPFYQYRINRDRFLMNPLPPAGHTIAFEYNSNFGVKAEDGIYKRYFSHDADKPVVPDRIFAAALRWRWKSEKGLDYAENFREYEEMASNAFATDATKPTLDMGGGMPNMKPGIMVPIGNWLRP